MEKNKVMNIKDLLKKYKEIILYLIFGALTTLVNIVVYFIFTRWCNFNAYISNIIAWFLSVLFAFITNKLIVFESKNKTFKIVLKESISFFVFRLLSLGIDMGSMYVMISILNWYDLISKIIANIIIIMLNYTFSKIYIFKKKSE